MLRDPYVEVGPPLRVTEVGGYCCSEIPCRERLLVNSILLTTFAAPPFDWLPANA